MGKKKKEEIKKEVLICTLDTETRAMFGKVFRLGMYVEIIDKYFVANSFNELYEQIQYLCKEYDLHVYVHNLDFDIAKIAPDLINKSTIQFSKSVFINGTAATIKTDIMTFHDSYKLLPSSLAKLCKDFGLDEDDSKMDMQEETIKLGYAVFNKDGSWNKKESMKQYFLNVSPHDPNLNLYLEKDCTSLYKVISKVLEISELEKEVFINCPTTPAMAMAIFKTQYNDDYKKATSTNYRGEVGRFIEDFVRLSYYGGRTEVFKPVLENGFHYDVNSLYPFVMKTCKFPIGYPVLLQGDDALRRFNIWQRRAVGGGFIWCKVHIPEDTYIPVLPIHDLTGKLIFPTGDLQGVWTFVELREALKAGASLIEVMEVVYFKEMDYIFKNYITYFEKIKTTSTGAKRNFAKLCQNALYGKFGMKRQRMCYADLEEIDKVKESKLPYRVHKNEALGLEFIEHVAEATANYIQPHIAAYVTSYARILLYRGLIQQDKKGEVNYCDTDSIAGTVAMPDDMVHDSEYGKWKLESVIRKGIFLQPKFYSEEVYKRDKQDNFILNDKGEKEIELTVHAKGIPKEIMETFTFQNYEEWLKEFSERKHESIHIFKGLEARQKFIRSVKNNEDLDKQLEMRKSINLLLEQKRQINYSENWTKPHTRYMFGDKCNTNIYEDIHGEYVRKLSAMNDDENEFRKCIKEYGYIRFPKSASKYYNDFMKISYENTKLYFRKNNKCLTLEKWCEVTGYNVVELLEDLIL